MFRARWIDPASGLLYQSGDAARGVPAGAARASGTALAAYFLSFADPALARDLFAAVARSQRASFLGFGGVRGMPPARAAEATSTRGRWSSASPCRRPASRWPARAPCGDRAFFTELYRTADLFGVPVDRAHGKRFAAGGPLGNAILLPPCSPRSGQP